PASLEGAFRRAGRCLDGALSIFATRLTRYDPKRMTSPPPPPIDIGTLLDDRYEIQAIVKRNGSCEFFQAHDREQQQPVVVRVIRHWEHDHEWWSWNVDLLREDAARARRVRHPNVCQVHDVE